MVHSIEKLLQVHIHHPSATLGRVFSGLKDRLVGAPPGAKSIAGFGKARIKDRLQYLIQRLLDQTVQGRGDAQLTHPFSAGFGDFHPQDRLWLVFAR